MFVRESGVHDYKVPGCEHPHLRDPSSGKFRKKMGRTFVYACTKLVAGALKHRSASDRSKFYGHEGQFSDYV